MSFACPFHVMFMINGLRIGSVQAIPVVSKSYSVVNSISSNAACSRILYRHDFNILFSWNAIPWLIIYLFQAHNTSQSENGIENDDVMTRRRRKFAVSNRIFIHKHSTLHRPIGRIHKLRRRKCRFAISAKKKSLFFLNWSHFYRSTIALLYHIKCFMHFTVSLYHLNVFVNSSLSLYTFVVSKFSFFPSNFHISPTNPIHTSGHPFACLVFNL